VRTPLVVLLSFVAAASWVGAAAARGGHYRIDGGTGAERRQVEAALDASSFDWGLVPLEIVIHIARDTETRAAPGEIWLNAGLVDAGTFAWGLIQHEYAHQVDFFLLDAPARDVLVSALGAQAWCYEVPGLRHQQYGCERFASSLAWAYWPSKDNCLRPTRRADEAGSVPPARFRALLTQLLSHPA